MNKGEIEKQEKTLAKLQWLTQRSKRDFKGNPSPFAISKTQKSVEAQKQEAGRALAGDTDFLPFWRSQIPLAVAATKTAYLRGQDNTKFENTRRENTLKSQNSREPETGFSPMQAALYWDVPAPHKKQPQYSYAASLPDRQQRRDPQYLNSLPPKERMEAYREELLAHPLITSESAQKHHNRWASGTQLTEEIVRPPRRTRNNGSQRRNCIKVLTVL